jgi:hypothetical protein
MEGKEVKSRSYLSFIRAPELNLVNIGRTHDPDARLKLFQSHSPVELRSDGDLRVTNWAQAKASEESLVTHLAKKQVRPGWFELSVREVVSIFEMANKGKEESKVSSQSQEVEVMKLEKDWFQAGYNARLAGRKKCKGWQDEDLKVVRASRSLWRLGYDAADKPEIAGSLYKDWIPV